MTQLRAAWYCSLRFLRCSTTKSWWSGAKVRLAEYAHLQRLSPAPIRRNATGDYLIDIRLQNLSTTENEILLPRARAVRSRSEYVLAASLATSAPFLPQIKRRQVIIL